MGVWFFPVSKLQHDAFVVRPVVNSPSKKRPRNPTENVDNLVPQKAFFKQKKPPAIFEVVRTKVGLLAELCTNQPSDPRNTIHLKGVCVFVRQPAQYSRRTRLPQITGARWLQAAWRVLLSESARGGLHVTRCTAVRPSQGSHRDEPGAGAVPGPAGRMFPETRPTVACLQRVL